MQFYENQLFHIYNEGNNRQEVFFEAENYRFFLWKMRMYLPVFGDLVAWCLLPNQFDWLFYVHKVEVKRKVLRKQVDETEYKRRVLKYGSRAQKVRLDDDRTASPEEAISLNHAIGDLLKGYAKAVNKVYDRSGSIWRGDCKAKDEWVDQSIDVTDSHHLSTHLAVGNSYARTCMRTIHATATAAGIVKTNENYEWSSAKDYAGLRKGSLCHLPLGRQILNEAG